MTYYQTKSIIYTLLLTIVCMSCSTSKNIARSTHESKLVIKETENSIFVETEKQNLEIKDTTERIIPTNEKPNKDTIENKETFLPSKLKESDSREEIFNTLLHKYVSKNGIVNYKGFITEKVLFKTYLNYLSENLPQDNWTKEDKLAYWMNTYNAFTIKLIIDNYPVKSIKDIKDPWNTRFFKLGKKWYNLNNIEHQILRKMNDPRIHFGINCASFSCPPLSNNAFTNKNVDEQLNHLARKFINDRQRNNITFNHIQLSKIFQWFAKDFKTQGPLIEFLNKYSEITINNNAKKTFIKYDWSLNE